MQLRILATVLIAAALGAAAAPAEDQGKKVDERSAPVTISLEGKLLVQEPVPLGGAAPAVLRTAHVGDRVLLQVAYTPDGSVVPKKVTAKAETPVLTVVDVLPTGQELPMTRPKDKPADKSAACFAVLVRANAAGECGLLLTCQMSDGSVKKVPFQFKVEK
jgi:hypothetical protein